VIFSSRPPPTILVIYGDGDGEAYVEYLRTAGFRAAAAPRIPHGEIVDRTLATMPDLILLDCHCDWKTLERLKADRRTAAIPVIALADLLVLPDRSRSCESALLEPDRLSIDPEGGDGRPD
jgi:DNA-binding response OmpR family regulator